jgi:hypothetical protein
LGTCTTHSGKHTNYRSEQMYQDTAYQHREFRVTSSSSTMFEKKVKLINSESARYKSVKIAFTAVFYIYYALILLYNLFT